MSLGKSIVGLFFSLILFACGNEENVGKVNSITISSITPTQSNSSNATFQDLTGNPIELSDFAGQRIFLNYWATWCVPCIREIPSIARAEAILKDENFIFLLVSDESIEEINSFVLENGFEGNFIKLNTFLASHGVEAVPSSFLFDENGKQLNGWLGDKEWDSPEALAELRK